MRWNSFLVRAIGALVATLALIGAVIFGLQAVFGKTHSTPHQAPSSVQVQQQPDRLSQGGPSGPSSSVQTLKQFDGYVTVQQQLNDWLSQGGPSGPAISDPVTVLAPQCNSCMGSYLFRGTSTRPVVYLVHDQVVMLRSAPWVPDSAYPDSHSEVVLYLQQPLSLVGLDTQTRHALLAAPMQLQDAALHSMESYWEVAGRTVVLVELQQNIMTQ